jgi:hypothetical protein
VALAAALSGKVPVEGRTVAVVCSGGNVDPEVFVKVLAQAWGLHWRLDQSVASLGTLLKKHWRWLILLLPQNCKRLESSPSNNIRLPQWLVKLLVAHCHRFRV